MVAPKLGAVGEGWLASALGRNIAGDIAAALDLDLMVPHFRGNLAGGLNRQALADLQLAFEAAVNFGILRSRGADEDAAFGNLDVLALADIGPDGPLDHKAVTGADLPGEDDAVADDELAGLGVPASAGPQACEAPLPEGSGVSRNSSFAAPKPMTNAETQ